VPGWPTPTAALPLCAVLAPVASSIPVAGTSLVSTLCVAPFLVGSFRQQAPACLQVPAGRGSMGLEHRFCAAQQQLKSALQLLQRRASTHPASNGGRCETQKQAPGRPTCPLSYDATCYTPHAHSFDTQQAINRYTRTSGRSPQQPRHIQGCCARQSCGSPLQLHTSDRSTARAGCCPRQSECQHRHKGSDAHTQLLLPVHNPRQWPFTTPQRCAATSWQHVAGAAAELVQPLWHPCPLCTRVCACRSHATAIFHDSRTGAGDMAVCTSKVPTQERCRWIVYRYKAMLPGSHGYAAA
jgi:hypothetical protein